MSPRWQIPYALQCPRWSLVLNHYVLFHIISEQAGLRVHLVVRSSFYWKQIDATVPTPESGPVSLSYRALIKQSHVF